MIDERARHQLYVTLEDRLGGQEADTLMELLPPVGWADVATKHDLLALEERIDLRFEAMDHRLDSFETRFDALEQRVATKADLAAFATKADLAALQRSMMSLMVGLLLTVTATLLTAMSLIR